MGEPAMFDLGGREGGGGDINHIQQRLIKLQIRAQELPLDLSEFILVLYRYRYSSVSMTISRWDDVFFLADLNVQGSCGTCNDSL